MNKPIDPKAILEALTIKLHRLMLAGQSETEEADAVRDDSLIYWEELADTDRAIIEGLSGDLFQIEGEEVYTGILETANDRLFWKRRFQTAYATNNWMRQLDLLRVKQDVYSPFAVALMRFRAYEGIGLSLAGLEFLRHACALDPDDEACCAMALLKLYNSGQNAQALEMIRKRAFPSVDYAQQIWVAVLLLMADLPEEERRDRLSGAIEAMTRLFEAGGVALGNTVRHLRSIVEAQRFSGVDEASILAALEGWSKDPDPEVLTALAWVRLEQGEPQLLDAAIRDLERALKSGGEAQEMFYLLAAIALANGDWERVLEMSTRGGSVANGIIQARLSSWEGVSRSMLNDFGPEAMEGFRRALEGAPGDEIIQHNWAIFRRRKAAWANQRLDSPYIIDLTAHLRAPSTLQIEDEVRRRISPQALEAS